MNFLKSLVSDDPDPPKPENPQKSGPHSSTNQSHEDHAAVDHRPPPSTSADSGGGGWIFGGLIQTITTRSESVLETYRHDLEEFGSGLKKETELFRDAASRAVKELPASIEVAHGAIDGVIKSTAEIISSQSKGSILPASISDPETPETNRSTSSGRFSRFESQLIALQNDINTFCEEPEDLEDYDKWKLGYLWAENSKELENLMKENGALESIYKRVVPKEVDNETFWCRYFYRVDKLKQQESVRASLVRRAIGIDDDEEVLSWDVDDDDEYEESGDGKAKESETRELGDQGSVKNVEEGASEEMRNVSLESKPIVENVDRGDAELREESVSGSSDEKAKPKEVETRELGDQSLQKNVKESSSEGTQNVGGKIDEENKESKPIAENVDEGDVELKKESVSGSSDQLKDSSLVINEEKKVKSEDGDGVKNAANVVNSEEKVGSEGKSDQGGSGKDRNVTVVSSQESVAEEEDMEWDEIEDIDSIDEKKVASLGMSSNRADVRKRLTVAEDDEDLSWDIEDDDEPVKT